MKKIALVPIAYGIFLAGMLSYSVLDTLVIPRTLKAHKVDTSYDYFANMSSSKKKSSNSKIVDPTSKVVISGSSFSFEPSSSSSGNVGELFSDTVIQTENLYVDQNIRVETKTEVIQTLRLKGEGTKDTVVYSANIYISHLSHLRTDYVKDKDGYPILNGEEYTTVMARNNNAVFALNGDTFGKQRKGYVVRNGQLIRSDRKAGNEDLIIYGDGSFEQICEDDYTANQIMERHPYQVFSFGPSLVKNGERVVEKGDEVEVFDPNNNNQRVSIGIVEPLHYVVAVCDARLDDSYGMQLFEMANYMINLGAKEAYNLDGGGSSAFYFNGELQNRPCTYRNRVEERGVSDIIYFA